MSVGWRLASRLVTVSYNKDLISKSFFVGSSRPVSSMLSSRTSSLGKAWAILYFGFTENEAQNGVRNVVYFDNISA